MTDLFVKKTDKERLLEWMQERPYFRTSDVALWGVKNYSVRAVRNAQELCEAGFITRMTEEETTAIYGKIGQSAWRVNKELDRNIKKI